MFKTALKKQLLSLYEKLVEIDPNSDLVPFCVQWGANYQKGGIAFIGRAVNDWKTSSRDCASLFEDNADTQIFARPDQMKWVEDTNYNSAFWNTIKQVTQSIYGCEKNWTSHVIWSNLYKLAPEGGGNPSDRLCVEQFDLCSKILQAELSILQPKIAVMLTGENWYHDFLCSVNNDTDPTSRYIEAVEWDGYETKVYRINDIVYLASQHPQGKPSSHINALIKLINKYK